MSDDIDRTDEYREQIAEDERRDRAIRNGQDPDDPGPIEPPEVEGVAAPAKRKKRKKKLRRDYDEHSGQIRIAYRLRDEYADKLLHVHGIGWHYWDGTRWAEDQTGYARRAVIRVLKRTLAESFRDTTGLAVDARRCESDAGIRGVLGVASALEEFAATVADLDADPYLLNTANGTLDLRTMERRPADPADRITKVTRAAYDPGASGSTWAEFLTRVLPDEDVREYLQRIIGVALLGTVVEHILAILTGTGANGKGTFYGTLLYALGDYGHAAEPDLFMQRKNAHPTGEMDLMGRRLVVVSESERDHRLDEAKMKRLTGGDRMHARRMRQDGVEFEPSHTPLLITNHLPRVSGDDAATWRRIHVIPFGVTIPEEEWGSGIEVDLQAEAAAVLTWALAGWEQYRKRKLLDKPEAVAAATDTYQLDSDAVGRFIAEECYRSGKATAADLFAAWERWRIVDGAGEISKRAFGQALNRHGFTSSDSNGKRWWHGLCILKIED